jgi:hypothetical protein
MIYRAWLSIAGLHQLAKATADTVAVAGFGLATAAIFCALTALVVAQQTKPLSVDDVTGLLRGKVSSTRVVRLVETNGVRFESTKEVLRRLEKEGASEAVISAVKTASARYVADRKPPLETTKGKGADTKDTKTKTTNSRCTEILNRAQLGEVMSKEDKEFLERGCK